MSIHLNMHVRSVFFFVISFLFYLEIPSHPLRSEILACELNDQLCTMNSQYEQFATMQKIVACLHRSNLLYAYKYRNDS